MTKIYSFRPILTQTVEDQLTTGEWYAFNYYIIHKDLVSYIRKGDSMVECMNRLTEYIREEPTTFIHYRKKEVIIKINNGTT